MTNSTFIYFLFNLFEYFHLNLFWRQTIKNELQTDELRQSIKDSNIVPVVANADLSYYVHQS